MKNIFDTQVEKEKRSSSNFWKQLKFQPNASNDLMFLFMKSDIYTFYGTSRKIIDLSFYDWEVNPFCFFSIPCFTWQPWKRGLKSIKKPQVIWKQELVLFLKKSKKRLFKCKGEVVCWKYWQHANPVKRNKQLLWIAAERNLHFIKMLYLCQFGTESWDD